MPEVTSLRLPKVHLAGVAVGKNSDAINPPEATTSSLRSRLAAGASRVTPEGSTAIVRPRPARVSR